MVVAECGGVSRLGVAQLASDSVVAAGQHGGIAWLWLVVVRLGF